jgi:hypothetical protein
MAKHRQKGKETMSGKETSQSQQWAASWQKAWQDQFERWNAAFAEMGKVETKGFEQVCANVDEAARLAKESAAYGNLLAAQWRKLAVDAARQAFEAIGTV